MNGIHRLGPWPEKVVAAFRDLGLTEQEIARYFRVHPAVVRQVERKLEKRAKGGLAGRKAGQKTAGRTQNE